MNLEEELASNHEKYHVLNNEYIEIKNKMAHLEQQRHDLIQEKLKVLVGKCFINKQGTFIVVDVPKYTHGISGRSHFNPYQIPVFGYVFNNQRDAFYKAQDGEMLYFEVYTRCIDSEDVIKAFIEEGNEPVDFCTFKNKMIIQLENTLRDFKEQK